jgi:hypothetical protein
MQNIFITAFITAIMGSSALVVFYHDRDETIFTLAGSSTEMVSRLNELKETQRVTNSQPAVTALTELKSRYSSPVATNRIDNNEDSYDFLINDAPVPDNESWEDSYICLHFPNGECPQDISIVSYGDIQTQKNP